MRMTSAFKRILICTSMLLTMLASTRVDAQHGIRHRLVNSSMAAGTIAQQFLIGDPSLANHVQPVQLFVPEATTVAIWDNGNYTSSKANGLTVGLGYGPVYRLKISNIPGYSGIDLYPSVEMVGRLHPPEGLAVKHPIRVVLDQSDFKHAIEGKMITKVVYIENPETALPFQRLHGHQPYFDCGPSEDPFHAAEGLGRVMLIVRMGSRVPLTADEFGNQLQGPPVQFFNEPVVPTETESKNTRIHRFGQTIQQTSFTQDLDVPPIVSAAQVSQRQAASSAPQVREISGMPSFVPYQVPAIGVSAATSIPLPASIPLHIQADTQKYNCQECNESDIPAAVRDEWVCDGNDRDRRVSVDSASNVNGLGIEDTIAHFDTIEGETLVSPSNRVCIYSPRFAAVRKVHHFSGASMTTHLGSVIDETKLEKTRGMDFDATTLQNIRLQGSRMARRPSSFRDRTRGVVADNTIHLNASKSSFRPFEDLQMMRWGKFSRTESSRLQLGMQSAIAWTEDLEPQMTVKNAQVIVVEDTVLAKEFVTVKSDHHPKLRLCKIASRISANPGEVVEFTIRFDNVGQEIISNVAILDNLSPRLEYIQGSASCTLDAEFSTESNGAGSLKLQWKISNPVDIRTGGIVRFQCRVR